MIMQSAIFYITKIVDSATFVYTVYKGNNKITELRAILQRESQNS